MVSYHTISGEAPMKYGELNEAPEDKPDITEVDEAGTSDRPLSEDELKIYRGAKDWEGMGLKEGLVKSLAECSYRFPSYIQKLTIPFLAQGNQNLFAQSQNGSGKTLCFVVGSLQKVVVEQENVKNVGGKSIYAPQVVVLVHVREMLQQLFNIFKNIKESFDDRIQISVIKSGDYSDLETHGHICISTLGAFSNALRGKITLERTNILVCDEADNVFESTNGDVQLNTIINQAPKTCMFLFFSATFTEKFKNFLLPRLKKKTDTKLRLIRLKNEELTLKSVVQMYHKTTNLNETMVKIFKESKTQSQTIVFCNNKKRATNLCIFLNNNQIPTRVIFSGDMRSEERDAVMKEFKSGKFKILITTNLLARGIDIRSILLVVNADIPLYLRTRDVDFETYLHRVGRTGRFGDRGVALNIIDQDNEMEYMQQIEKHFGTTLQELASIEKLDEALASASVETNKVRTFMDNATDI
eukprot:TRINITY_DN8035_c0_g1_i9.p2 TRINITY_DN8035_c0_g1~~TRINITY_DN8035_c0_g1_i9.p2  ORF type:complete len:470 (-),score=165.53 TRINITY_DN8035_c0_g1_i9:276-1685(-)